jgi:hypothetical protein
VRPDVSCIFLDSLIEPRGESEHWKNDEKIVPVAPHQRDRLLLQPQNVEMYYV